MHSIARSATDEHGGRHPFRLILLLMLILPLIPELLIWGAALLAKFSGCRPDQQDVCLIGSLPVSDVIVRALEAGASFILGAIRNSERWFVSFYVSVAAWLGVCYLAIILGWAGTASRLFIGFVVSLAFAILPYFGPMLALANLAHDACRPNDGYVGPCTLFGGDVGPRAHDAVNLGWLGLIGAPLGLAMFVIYVIVVGILAWRRRDGRGGNHADNR